MWFQIVPLAVAFLFIFRLHFPLKFSIQLHPNASIHNSKRGRREASERDKYSSCHHKIFKPKARGGSSRHRAEGPIYKARTPASPAAASVPSGHWQSGVGDVLGRLRYHYAHLSGAYKLAWADEKTLCVRRAMWVMRPSNRLGGTT